MLGKLGEDIAARPALSEAELQSMLDTVTHAEKGIKSIYIIDDQERVIGIGLPKEGRAARQPDWHRFFGTRLRRHRASAARPGLVGHLPVGARKHRRGPGQAGDSSRQ